MAVHAEELPKRYHDAVLKWQGTYLPDLDYLLDNWQTHFPKEPNYKLCALRELGVCQHIEVGSEAGKPKYTKACEMSAEQATHLLKAVKAQASTEFGSIQQHRLTLARAQDEQDQMWVMRMMAEELRHGYQMLSLLLNDDWKGLVGQSGEEMVEEILSMEPGTHVLGAFNIDFDSFVDNVTFCALIDRVGKYQLAMQKVSAYQPMAESMPPMLREEAFHLAAGVIPLRRWMQAAARGQIYVTVEAMQRSINKWLPRGLEMFGDERGGASNIKLGFKDMKNFEALKLYYAEVTKMVRDLNSRFLRERLPSLSHDEVELVQRRIDDGETVEGIQRDHLLHLPAIEFCRRRGAYAYQMCDVHGRKIEDFTEYRSELLKALPEAYRATRDFSHYLDLMERVARGELSADEAQHRSPALSRVGGNCPCSKSVRWLEPAAN
jgi:benzoyl-CoA 2,3-dioxygenase component B